MKIKRLILIAVGHLFVTSIISGQDSVPEKGLFSITAQELYAHVAFLASDDMLGRNTPSAELDSAARYIAAEFKAYGLDDPCGGDTYFQNFIVNRLTLSSPNVLLVYKEDGKEEFQIKNDFVPLDISANGALEAEVVFVGYGITADEYNYDDYKDVDAKDKIVLMLSNEPQEEDSTSIFEGLKNTKYSKLSYKAENALEHGAAAILYVRNPNNTRFRRPPNTWPSLLRAQLPEGSKAPLRYGESEAEKLVAMAIGLDCAESLIDNSGKTLSEWQSAIDETLSPHSFLIEGKKVKVEVNLNEQAVTTQNVVGFLEGRDPLLKDELVIIGAHYDHVGVFNGVVYNGADDNASGTAGVIEIAEAFASCEQHPLRSVLFITFAGEEKGLFGSRYYTEHPIAPLNNVVTMLNLDMISRNDSNEVAIIGSKTSPDLNEFTTKANEKIGLSLKYSMDGWFMQSDHYSFYKESIPVLFYNTMNHPDLHQPGDDVEKIIPEKMEKICKLIFSTAWMVANRTERPNFVSNAY